MLDEKTLHILDIIYNLGPIDKWGITHFWLTKEKRLTEEEINASVSELLHSDLIVTKKDNINFGYFTINPHKENDVFNILKNYWDDKIKKEILYKLLEENLGDVIKILDFKIQINNNSYVSFIDDDLKYSRTLLNFCQKLFDINMVFRETFSSRKHYYEDYYFRKKPINVEQELQNYIKSKKSIIAFDDFKIDKEWRVLLLPLFSDYVNITDVEAIFPNLTRDELLELLKNLEEKGALNIYGSSISIPKAIKEMIKPIFLQKIYLNFESWMIQQLRKRVSENISNLYLLGTLKKILISSNAIVDGPFAIINKYTLRNEYTEELKNITKLGLVFSTQYEVIIAKKVLEELENLLKSKIFEKVVRVPANDTFMAITIWKRIFGEECADYIKIQDEYVNEESLRIIQSYSQPGIKIKILTSIEGARDFDVGEMKRIVNEMKNSNRKLEIYFIGDSSGKAPFHFRYIISKDVCYSISTSIKQVGKTKDADIIRVSKEEKEGLIEPAFDYWAELNANKLKEKGLNRYNFDEWIKAKDVKSISQ